MWRAGWGRAPARSVQPGSAQGGCSSALSAHSRSSTAHHSPECPAGPRTSGAWRWCAARTGWAGLPPADGAEAARGRGLAGDRGMGISFDQDTTPGSPGRKGPPLVARTLTPCPLSWTCRTLTPPSLAVTVIDVAPASREFSINSFSALAGRWTTSPAAILFTTAGSSRTMAVGPAGAMAWDPDQSSPWSRGAAP